MLNINKEQKELISKYFNPDAMIDNDNIGDLLDELDDLITDIGFDKNYELTEEGLKLQLVYDQIYAQN